jgi:hypothetical protein
MDSLLETRPSLVANDRLALVANDRPSLVADDLPPLVESDRPLAFETRPVVAEPATRRFAPINLPASQPGGLSSLDIAAGVLMAVMMIGPLAAAAIGRMMT